MSRTSLNIVVFLLLLTSCSSFQKIELYDVYMESDEVIERVMLNVEQTQLWYNLGQCGNHEFKTVNDERVLHLDWNKIDCEWVGFGNSWSNFEADDISEIYASSAIRIQVKTVGGTQQFLPFVVGLEDYSGGSSYIFSDTRKYMDGLEINQDDWSYLYLPLWHFDFSQQGVDPFGIKQMVIQLEGSGNVYLKEIKVVSFNEELYDSLETSREALRPKGKLPQSIFPNDYPLEYMSWGLNNLSEEVINWTRTEKEHRWGINWNNWYPINFRGFEASANLYLITNQHTSSFGITLSAFNGAYHSVFIDNYIPEKKDSLWSYTIPLKDFEILERNIQKDRIKQLEFVSDDVDVKIYNIKIDK